MSLLFGRRRSDAGGDAPALDQYATYDDYLDSQVTAKDRYYLQDDELARQLVELGYRGHGAVVKRDEFAEKQRAAALVRYGSAAAAAATSRTGPGGGAAASPTEATPAAVQLSSAGLDLSGYPLLNELARREQDILNGKLTTILFIRDQNSKGHEISGYIDYGHRLKVEDFQQYFTRKKRLLPRPTDLSYYNWKTQLTVSTSSPNFQVIFDNGNGIFFKNKRDRKVIQVDPKCVAPGDNSTRKVLKTDEYFQVVIYDHLTRRNA